MNAESQVAHDVTWTPADDRPLAVLARNIGTRYIAITVELLLGLVMLPFNLHHLGQEAYGLWMLVASVTIHFSILDMGYGGALVNFIARYRAFRDARALNEIASTLFVVFSAFGLLSYLIMVGLAFNLEHIFKLAPGQAETGRIVLLIIGINVAGNFAYSVYGGIIGGFQRYDINNFVAIVSSVAVALVNVMILALGYGLIPLVAATTLVRMLTYVVYRRNAYQTFPGLRISLAYFRRDRLRELTSFSVYSSIIDWANKLNYELDEIVVGIFLGSASVAVWAVADRIISGTQRLTNQSNTVLFPVVVDSHATKRIERLQQVLLEGTRLSLASVVPIAVVLIVLAKPLVIAWVGPRMLGAVAIIQILAVAVALRVGNATSTTLLKGAGRIRFLAGVNIVTGLVNFVISAILVKPLGLAGVAIGTVVPVAVASGFVLWPVACRRVELPVLRAFRHAVWPTVWPAVVVGLMLEATKPLAPVTLLAVMAQAAIAAVVYVALFALAIGRRDRAQYLAKLRSVIGRGPGLAPAA